MIVLALLFPSPFGFSFPLCPDLSAPEDPRQRQGFSCPRGYVIQFSMEGKSRIVRLLLRDGLIGIDLAVADVDDAVRMLRNVMFVGHEINGFPLPMQFAEKRHDRFARFRIEVPGGSFAKRDPRGV